MHNGTQYDIWWVTSVNGQQGAVTLKTVNNNALDGSGDIAVQAVLNQLTSAQIKTGTATTDSSVTASALAWAVPVLSTQANNLLTSWMKIWVWTQANYEALDSYDNSTAYLTI